MTQGVKQERSLAGIVAGPDAIAIYPLRPSNPRTLIWRAAKLSGFFLPLLFEFPRGSGDKLRRLGRSSSKPVSSAGAWVRKVRARDSVMQSITDSLTELGKDNAKPRCLRKPYARPSSFLGKARHLGVLCLSASATRAGITKKVKMTKEEYQHYLQSEHWKQLRRMKLEAAAYKCDSCGSRYLLQVHHLKYRNIYDVQLADLEVLCRYCHEKQHGIESGIRPIKPDTKQLLKGQFNAPRKFTASKPRSEQAFMVIAKSQAALFKEFKQKGLKRRQALDEIRKQYFERLKPSWME